MAEQEDKGAILREALAEYYDCDPEEIGGWIVICEKNDPEAGLQLTTAWNTGVPFWTLLGFINQAEHEIDKRYRGGVNVVMNGEVPTEVVDEGLNRAARRGRRGSRR